MTQLALFDLDRTLLPFDSDYEWGQFLVLQGVVDAVDYAQKNEHFYVDYKLGKLDINAFLCFALKPLSEHPPAQLQQWHDAFMAEVIIGKLHPAAILLVRRHQEVGDVCCVVTATNRFVNRPIVKAFGVTHLVAPEPATVNHDAKQIFMGRVHGILSFRGSKIQRVQDWLASLSHAIEQMEKSYFYSDSLNNLPLLEVMSHPIATNPDPRLRAEAEKRQWPILELFA